MYVNDLPTWVGPASAGIVALFVLVPVWLTVSRTSVARKFRIWRDSDTASAAGPKVPHVHVIDGVVIMHSHAHGDAEHSHETVQLSVSDYVALVKSRNNGV